MKKRFNSRPGQTAVTSIRVSPQAELSQRRDGASKPRRMAESFVGTHRRVDQSSLRDYGSAERFL